MGHPGARVIEVATAARPVSRVHVGWAAFLCTSLAGAVALALDLAAGTYHAWLYIAVTEVIALLGLLLTSRRPEHRVAWVMAVAALWWAIANLSFAYAVEALVSRPGSLPGGLAAAWLDNWAWLPGLALFLCALIVLMPDGHLASRRWWPVPAMVVAGTVLGSLWVSASSKFDLPGAKIANPFSSNNAVIPVAGVFGVVLVVGGVVASLAALIVRYRRSAGDEHQQLWWVVVSLCVAVSLAVIGSFAWGVVPGAKVLPAAALLALPAGISVAILKHRLYELDLVVNRALVYAALTVGVVATYVLVVGLVGSYLSRRGDLVASLVVTGIVAVSFQPARERVQRVVNRLMYGNRNDPYLAMAALSRTLAGSLQADTVLPTAVETIGRTLALQYVGVAANGATAAYGTPSDADMLTVALVHHDAGVGELLLAPRPGEQLRERDRRLIADLAPQVAAAVHAVSLSRELNTARQRLIELREEERRRIRRDLHDGLGPALAGLTFTLEAVRNHADSDLERADQLLASATAQVQTLIGDVRTLIYGLRPPALDELGLAAALRALATRDSTPETGVTVHAPSSLPELPAAVEVAAYWIAREALTNVRRHAHAHGCTIRLAVEPSAVSLEIEDDGVGPETRRRVSASIRCASAPPSWAVPASSARPPSAERSWLRHCQPGRIDDPADPDRDRGRPPTLPGRAARTPRIRPRYRGRRGSSDRRRGGPGRPLAPTGRHRHGHQHARLERHRRDSTDHRWSGRRQRARDDDARRRRGRARGDPRRRPRVSPQGSGTGRNTSRDPFGLKRRSDFGPRIAVGLQRFLAASPQSEAEPAFPQLTDRELEILHLLAQRRTNAQIAAELYLSQKTVRNYVSAIFAKLQVADRAEAGLIARAAGLGTLNGDPPRSS